MLFIKIIIVYLANNRIASKCSNVGVTLVGTYSNHCSLDGYNI